MRILNITGHVILILLLTILTQVGGLIWLIAVLISIKIKRRKRIIFPLLYLSFNLILIPPLASFFGREPLPLFNANLKPVNPLYPLLFRNYVSPELKDALYETSTHLSQQNIEITYLDANFPFINGFPLFPHLSHDDGKKIDLSFMYLDKKGQPTNKKPSLSGYGAFVKAESKQSKYCLEKGYWQYDMIKYLNIKTNNNLLLDKVNTKELIQQLLGNPRSQKLFIEPYLKHELGLSNYSKIRFHGCHSVRHDDHIHFQIK